MNQAKEKIMKTVKSLAICFLAGFSWTIFFLVSNFILYSNKTKITLCLLGLLIFCHIPPLHAAEVVIAGFAFSGEFESAEKRFPYTYQLYERIQSQTSAKKLSYLITQRTKEIRNPEITIPEDGLVNLGKSHQALMAALVLTGETIVTENYGSYYKTFVNLRANALIFDYKNQTVVSSYPISIVLFDAIKEKPAPHRIASFVENIIRREDENGLISQFVQRLETASIPKEGTRTIQIRKCVVKPEALSFLPESLQKNPIVAEAILIDGFSSNLSSKLHVPILPSTIGHINGVMSLRLENGDDYTLNVGEGDYIFDLNLNKFAKLEISKNNIGTTYVYGAYMSVHFYEPALNTDFIKTDLKNGEVAIVPAGRISTDDFAGYQDALQGLFRNFSAAFQDPNFAWLRKAASEKNIKDQIKSAIEIIRKCK